MRYRPPTPDAVVLERHEGVLEARGVHDPPGTGVRIEWPVATASGRMVRRDGPRPRAAGSPLLRAIGDASSVIDATGGFGHDAWTIAGSGRRVTIIERSTIVASLLEDALDRARRDEPVVASRIALVHGDAREWLRTRAETGGVATASGPSSSEAIYLDPMFPAKRRASALPSKEMQFLAAIVGADEDASDLLAVARLVACGRVVVKRPPKAPPLGAEVVCSIASKLLRFDVYRGAGGSGFP